MPLRSTSTSLYLEELKLNLHILGIIFIGMYVDDRILIKQICIVKAYWDDEIRDKTKENMYEEVSLWITLVQKSVDDIVSTLQ